MERLTVPAVVKDGKRYSPIIDGNKVRECAMDFYWRLKEYEDAEEQGSLLRLPCKVGDTAWVIDEDFEYPKKKKIYEAKWKRVTLVQVSTNHSFELKGEVSYKVYDCFYNDGRTMSHGMYVGQHNTKVGEVVFLTREEAEQALKEGVKNGYENEKG